MAGIRLAPEDSDVSHARALTTADLISDDDRSVAADSWSIKSDYGSTLDDEQRHADAAEALSAVPHRDSSDYSSDKEEPDAEAVTSMLGFQNYWDSAYANELANYREHGHAGEVWFGADVMETVASWTKSLCTDNSQGHLNYIKVSSPILVKLITVSRFADVDDVLETKLERKYQLVMDKGTLDAIGLHPDGPIKRIMYWDSVSRLVASGGILVITSCNSTKDELVQEVNYYNRRRIGASQEAGTREDQTANGDSPPFRYLDHVRSNPTFMFGGSVGSRVATVAFLRN
ncbi:hypothetical protein RHMOL_Rhmol08G0097200 [Rhododendron molle]|uniref:Uncharacterized protein n=1 Tax=Rhododendron molle TaxID=49168 RepID=A0ACC0MMR2_RHOML|nr:hypothetical protein RHMOL_Rhmol08G0097200 [Rhododendron molle]